MSTILLKRPRARQPRVSQTATANDAPVSLADVLRVEMAWLSAAIDTRVRTYFGQNGTAVGSAPIPGPPPLPSNASYARMIDGLGVDDTARNACRLLLALALAPHVAPQILDVFFLKNENIDRGFTEFGGIKGIHHAGFLPTGETALFLLCGDNLALRLEALAVLDLHHPLFTRGPLRLATPAPDEPAWSGALSFSPSHLRSLVTGEEPRPELGLAFPARPVTTALTWDDLVLDAASLTDVNEIKVWAKHRHQLLDDWGLGRHLKPGYRALFHGPSGTGKTLTASLLGKELGVDVYRVDLSQVVSKYIGETEKNLAVVFAEAERRSWILFFDEADALFGKRTQASSAHDRYANQEVAYLLQRVEDHPGIVILATNLKSNLDEAFARRFQTTVHFAPPNPTQRQRLWQAGFGERVRFDASVSLPRTAHRFELTGGQIMNVVRYACMIAVQNGGHVSQRAIDDGCRRELRNLGRTT